MKNITLQETYSVLQNCSAVIADDDILVYPSLEELTGEDSNEFLYLSWSNDGLDFNLKFLEGNNKSAQVSGTSLFLKDNEGEEVQLTLLHPVNLE